MFFDANSRIRKKILRLNSLNGTEGVLDLEHDRGISRWKTLNNQIEESFIQRNYGYTIVNVFALL